MNSEINIEIVSGPTKLAWPLTDLAEATGMSVAFWKKVIGKGEIAATKGGNRTLIIDEDLREWLMKNRKVREKKATANGNGHESKAPM